MARICKARQIAQLGDQSDGSDKLHAPQGLERLDDGRPAPRLDLRVELRPHPLQAGLAFRDRPDTFLKDDLLGGGGTDHGREPAQLGRAPIGPPGIANIVAQQEGFEPRLGSFEIFERVFAGPRQITDGFTDTPFYWDKDRLLIE